MKENLLLITASLVALGIAAPAVAADVNAPVYKAQPPMVAMYDWSGFYVGINGGGGRDHFSGSGLSATGGTVGGQIGYRWQTSNWVFGLEGQGNWADFSGRRSVTLSGWQGGGTSPGSNIVHIESFALLTGHVGYSWNNVLLYLKGGAAVVDNKYNTDCINNGIYCAKGNRLASADVAHWGGTVGTGLEIGFASNWSVGVEYDHIFLDRKNFDMTVSSEYGGAVAPQRAGRQDIDMGLVRLNYKFGGPVVARY